MWVRSCDGFSGRKISCITGAVWSWVIGKGDSGRKLAIFVESGVKLWRRLGWYCHRHWMVAVDQV